MNTLTAEAIADRTHTGPSPVRASYTAGKIWIEVSDGRRVSFPCAANEHLAKATAAQRRRIELSADGLHWPDLDEDLSLSGILAGRYGRSHGGRRVGAGRPRSGKAPVLLRLPIQVLANGRKQARKLGVSFSELVTKQLREAHAKGSK